MISKRGRYESGREYALRCIRENIINLELEPDSFISENELSKELGISRTPVREALRELEKLHVVDIIPQKGTHISQVDYALVNEANFMRKTLEVAAIELACQRALPEDIAALRENLVLQRVYSKNNMHEKLMLLDNQLHGLFFRIAQKENVFAAVMSMTIHFDRVRSMARLPFQAARVVREHEQIVSALADRAAERAKSLMAVHLEQYQVDEIENRAQYPAHYFAKQSG